MTKKVFILSLKNSDRREVAQARADKLFGSDAWSFFDPVSLNDLACFDCEKSKKHYGYSITGSEMSCALSHYLMICNPLIDIVLEDDFLPLRESIPFGEIRDLLSKMDAPTVVCLGHSKTRAEDFWIQKLKQPLVGKRLTLTDENVMGENYSVNFYGTVSYIFNESFKESISSINKIWWKADDWHEIVRATGATILHVRDKYFVEDFRNFPTSSTGNKLHFRHGGRGRMPVNLLKAFLMQLLKYSYPSYFLKR